MRDRHANLISFVHEGMDAETVRRIGHHPVGKGLLSLSLLDTPALRMDDLTAHPAAAGFPEHHPAMRAFLAVPITIRGAVFGNLYLTHVDEARVFSDADEMAARALAFAAAVAIDNAQVFERERMSVKWIEASREITTALLSRTEPHRRPMQLIAERACALTDAEQAIVLVPADPEQPGNPEVDTLVVSAAVGLPAADVLGQRVPVRGSTSGAVFKSGEPLITDEFRYPIQAFTDAGRRPAIVMPLRARDEVVGVIAIARGTEQPPFDESYLDLVRDFATHAAIALVLPRRARTRGSWPFWPSGSASRTTCTTTSSSGCSPPAWICRARWPGRGRRRWPTGSTGRSTTCRRSSRRSAPRSSRCAPRRPSPATSGTASSGSSPS